jgi:hypothetical protein
MIRQRVIDTLFLAALFTVSFIALRWRVDGVEPKLADIFIVGFLVAYVAELARTRRHLCKPALIILGCAGVIAVAYLAALPAIDDHAGRVQFVKALCYFVLHAAFLAAGVDQLAVRSPRFFRIAFGCLLGGIAVNGAYAALQLVTAMLGFNLDAAVLTPLTGAHARSVWYGVMYGPDVMRARGFTRDPNHLGVMLVVPALAFLALSATVRHARRPAMAAWTAGLVFVLMLTLSRSAVVGLIAGVLFLVACQIRTIRLRAIVLPLAAAAAGLALIAAANPERAEHVALARLGLHGFSGAQHFRTYLLIRPALENHLLFGVGLNNFPLTYAQHVNGVLEASDSFYVQSLVEAGVVGSAIILFVLVYLLLRLRQLDSHPLAPALGAALVGTLAANAFYMTLTFSYFAAFLIFVVAAIADPGVAARKSSDPRYITLSKRYSRPRTGGKRTTGCRGDRRWTYKASLQSKQQA